MRHLQVDTFGRYWFANKEQLCEECGQLDNDKTCDHYPMSIEEVLALKGYVPKNLLPKTEKKEATDD